MPEFSGLDFAEILKAKFGSKTPKIIFTTGDDRYAISGYNFGVVDYLLKP